MTDSEKEYFSELYDKHAKSVYGTALMYLKNKEDAEETVSETFIKIMQTKPPLENDAHARAYLIRTAVNICKNLLKSPWHRSVVHDEDVMQYMAAPEQESVMEEILRLPPKYRAALYMHYYEGYKAQEIADMLGISLSSVLSRLSRGRGKLKDILVKGGYFYV